MNSNSTDPAPASPVEASLDEASLAEASLADASPAHEESSPVVQPMHFNSTLEAQRQALQRKLGAQQYVSLFHFPFLFGMTANAFARDNAMLIPGREIGPWITPPPPTPS